MMLMKLSLIHCYRSVCEVIAVVERKAHQEEEIIG